ncbi:MAG: alpha/beta hydrolase [Rhodocyclaceae bacterium]|nr:alpha/beta hydrolase [Rhodocyclaceae bacterium]
MGLFSRLFGRRPAVSSPRFGEVLCAGAQSLHRMRYVEWGDPDNPRVLVCVHGLTRNARDFDRLAAAMAGDYRIVCPDVVGRGRSDWLGNPAGYGFPQYVADMMVLLARLGVAQVDWLGTSMGGLIGMLVASQAHSPVRRLLLNDVGPVITAESLRRIGEYVGKAPRFADMAEAERYIRFVSAPFGKLDDAAWRELTESSVRRDADGSWSMAYDPALAEPFRQAYLLHQDVDLWPVYDAIRCPTLVVRGARSDLLTAETHRAMGERGPRAQLVEIADVGHAPMFLDAAQIAVVRRFFGEGI